LCHDRGATHGDCKNIRKFVQPKLDPLLAVEFSFALGEQERPADAVLLRRIFDV
jgi:hypothetical protein